MKHINYSWVNKLLVGAAVGIAGASFYVKEDELKKTLRLGGALLWGSNVIETLFGSSFSYLGNAKNTDQAQHTMNRMRKMSPEIRQTIHNYHYEVVEQQAQKEELPEIKEKSEREANKETHKKLDAIDEEILAEKIMAKVKA